MCAYLNGASSNIKYPNITTNPIYYDTKDMVSPSYGHHDCTTLLPLYNPNCKHRTGTLLNYNKCYASLLIVPFYEENEEYYDKKLFSQTNML